MWREMMTSLTMFYDSGGIGLKEERRRRDGREEEQEERKENEHNDSQTRIIPRGKVKVVPFIAIDRFLVRLTGNDGDLVLWSEEDEKT